MSKTRLDDVTHEMNSAAEMVTRLVFGGNVALATDLARNVWAPLAEEYEQLWREEAGDAGLDEKNEPPF